MNVIGAESENGNLNLGFKDTDNGTVLASAKIPQDTFKNKSQVVYSFLFRNDLLFQTAKVQSQLSSKILAVSIGKEKIENLTNPILLTFKKTEKISQKEQQTVDGLCFFWDSIVCKYWLFSVK